METESERLAGPFAAANILASPTSFTFILLLIVVFVIVRVALQRRRERALRLIVSPARLMGMSERAFDCMHHMGAFVIVQVVRVQGAFAVDSILVALRLLQVKHALLRVHARDASGIFDSERTTEIPLRVVVDDSIDAWKREVLVELHDPIPYGRSPLMRATIIREAGRASSTILLTSNHAIYDGASAVTIVRDLMTFISEVESGNAPNVTEGACVGPLDSALPESSRGPRPSERPPKLLPIDREEKTEQRRSAVLYAEIPASVVSELGVRCRTEQTTVHGALSAAALCSARSVFGKEQEMSLASNVSVRGALVPAMSGDEVGCFISAVTTTHAVRADTPFWNLAREIREAIGQSIDRGDHLRLLTRQFGVIEAFLLRTLVPRVHSGRLSAINVSNSGRFDIPIDYGTIRLSATYAMASQHVIGSGMQIAVMTIGQTTFAAFTYAEPTLSREHAEKFVDRFMRGVARASQPGEFTFGAD